MAQGACEPPAALGDPGSSKADASATIANMAAANFSFQTFRPTR